MGQGKGTGGQAGSGEGKRPCPLPWRSVLLPRDGNPASHGLQNLGKHSKEGLEIPEPFSWVRANSQFLTPCPKSYIIY